MFWRPLIALSLWAFSAAAMNLGPEQSHGTMRFGAEAVYHSGLQLGLGVNYRFGLHDMLDRQIEYPQFTQVDFLGFRAEYYPAAQRFFFDSLTLVKVLRLPLLTAEWDQLSWSVEVGGRTVRESLCTYCGAGNIAGGIGLTVQPIASVPVDLWLLAEAEVLGAPGFSGFFLKPSVGPRGGLRLRLSPTLNGFVSGVYRYQFASDPTVLEAEIRGRWSFAKNWALDARWVWREDGWTLSSGILLYD